MYSMVVPFALVLAAAPKVVFIGFDSFRPGTLPAGWTARMTHSGDHPRWEVVLDASAPSRPAVLAQLSTDRTAGRFPLAILENSSFLDGSLTVSFKPVSGVVDQAAGIVWRFRDPDNYYIVRANALENNIVLYKVAGGLRTSIAPKGLPSRSYGVKHTIPNGRWSTLRVDVDGSRFTVILNGERLFEAEDTTLQSVGKVGLWTKADSVIYFDDFTISNKTGDLRKP